MATLSAWDYVVFISTLVLAALIGLYYRFTGGKQKSTKEYLLADRSMPFWPVSFSLMASFISAVTILGAANEMYSYGVQYILVNVAYGLATPVTAYLFLPVFYNLNTASAYEYLERRFGKATRLTCSISFTLSTILYMGIALLAPALVLEAVTGINKDWAVVIIGAVCTFYTFFGGMKAVLMTDVFQSLLIIAAVYISIIYCLIQAGGVGPIYNAALEGGRLDLFSKFELDPTVRHTWWSVLIGTTFTTWILDAVNQTQVQRLLTVKDLKNAQLAIWVKWPVTLFVNVSCCVSGFCIYWFYKNCDPFLQGAITARDQILPLFIMDATAENYKGLPGLFVAGVFAACLSTISSAVNCISAVVAEDYIKMAYWKVAKKELPDKTIAYLSKITALIAGILCIAVAFLAKSFGALLQAALTLFGGTGGPILAVFALGMSTTRATQRGVIGPVLLVTAFGIWLTFGGPRPPIPTLEFSTDDCSAFERTSVALDRGFSPLNGTLDVVKEPVDGDDSYLYLYRMSYMWVAPMISISTFVLGYALSWILEIFNYQGESKIYVDKDKTTINYDLFMPPVAKWMKKRQMKLEK